MKTLNYISQLFLILIMGAVYSAAAQIDEITVPADVRPFVGDEMSVIALASADLNGDGTTDHVLVVEKTTSNRKIQGDDQRTLMIIIRVGGKLKLAKTNSNVVYCRSCGGAFGDPFAGLVAKRNSFTVDNYGGSSWRWSESYKFSYSRRDRTWQLVMVASDSFNALDPNVSKTRVRTPKSFGKIDIADFDTGKIK